MPGKVAASKNAWRRQQKKKLKDPASWSPLQNSEYGYAKLDNQTSSMKPLASRDQSSSLQGPTKARDESPFLDTDVSEDSHLFAQFQDVLQKFSGLQEDEQVSSINEKPDIYFDENDEIQDEDEERETAQRISKKKRKEQAKLSIAELKALVDKPDLVEWTDTSAAEPKLHVGIKSTRNIVPVPGHWSLKREYLSSKRGIEKPAFALPRFIQETGIAEMRDAVQEKQDQTSLKQKQRERVQPKMGKLDIDYQKLYEAFFRFQTKPELTRFGEVYYEGKEYETNLRHLRPGELSDELKEALSIPPGAPPPWLINQQRYGMPPSYPTLKIPGLNAPPPPGAQWGFHAGGYGKPPVDEYNRPLYGGDLYGFVQDQHGQRSGELIEKALWGELQAPEEDEEDDDDDDDDDDDEGDDDDDEADSDGMRTEGAAVTEADHATNNAIRTSGLGTNASNADEARDEFTLRKQRKSATQSDETKAKRSAGTVVQERGARASGLFGSDKSYDIQALQNGVPILGQEEGNRKRKIEDVDIAVDIDALDANGKLSKEEVQQRFDAGRKEQQPRQWTERTSDDHDAISKMIAEEHRKKLKQDQERQERRDKSKKF